MAAYMSSYRHLHGEELTKSPKKLLMLCIHNFFTLHKTIM